MILSDDNSQSQCPPPPTATYYPSAIPRPIASKRPINKKALVSSSVQCNGHCPANQVAVTRNGYLPSPMLLRYELDMTQHPNLTFGRSASPSNTISSLSSEQILSGPDGHSSSQWEYFQFASPTDSLLSGRSSSSRSTFSLLPTAASIEDTRKMMKNCTFEILERRLRTDCQPLPITAEGIVGLGRLSRSIAEEILLSVKRRVKTKCYKLVTMATLGSCKDSKSFKYRSQCLWDDSLDWSITVNCTNDNVFAMAVVYAIYSPDSKH